MKRYLALAAALTLAIATLAGCSGTTATPAPTAVAKSEAAEPGTLPIVETPFALRIFFQKESQVLDYENNKLTKYLEDQTGISIRWDLVAAKDRTQKMNLILATGQDLPDVFMGGMPTSLLVEHASQGTFIALNSYIKKDSRHFTEVLSVFPDLQKIMTAPDGNIYAMPSINTSEPNMMSSRLWINRVWLDKLGLKVPTTTAELRTVLSVFKTRDPNGNGIQDEIPLMGATTGWSTTVEPFLLNSFLQYPNTGTISTQRYVLENGAVRAPYIQSEYRAGLQYLHGLVEDGLLDMATFTQDAAQLRTIFEDPDAARIGAVTSGGPNAHADVNGERYRDYVAVPPLMGPTGVRLSNYNPYQYVNQANCYVITKACTDPEAAFRFCDFMYSQDVSMRTRLGEPGTDWIPAPAGKRGVDGEPALYEAILVYGSEQRSHWQNRNPYYNSFDNKGVRSDNPFELQGLLWDTMLAYKPYTPAVRDCMPPLVYSLEESMQMNEINTVLEQFIDETRVEFITSGGIEAGWVGYLAELDAIGYGKILEITQTAYDRFRR